MNGTKTAGRGINMRTSFVDMPKEFYDALTFGELEVGSRYISLPVPGNNSGHGGFREGSYVFQKIVPVVPVKDRGIHDRCGTNVNTIRLENGILTHMSDGAPVAKLM